MKNILKLGLLAFVLFSCMGALSTFIGGADTTSEGICKKLYGESYGYIWSSDTSKIKCTNGQGDIKEFSN